MEEAKAKEKDLIVDVSPSEVRIALMEDHRLIEYNRESAQGHDFSVGDVFLGRVTKILPSLNAAFVDIGDTKEAFIHYLDLGLFFPAFDQFVRDANPNRNLHGLYSGIKLGKPMEKEQGQGNRSGVDDQLLHQIRYQCYERSRRVRLLYQH